MPGNWGNAEYSPLSRVLRSHEQPQPEPDPEYVQGLSSPRSPTRIAFASYMLRVEDCPNGNREFESILQRLRILGISWRTITRDCTYIRFTTIDNFELDDFFIIFGYKFETETDDNRAITEYEDINGEWIRPTQSS